MNREVGRKNRICYVRRAVLCCMPFIAGSLFVALPTRYKAFDAIVAGSLG